MDKSKLVSHFEGGGGGGGGTGKKRGRRRKRRAKCMDFVLIFMGFYGLVWILV